MDRPVCLLLLTTKRSISVDTTVDLMLLSIKMAVLVDRTTNLMCELSLVHTDAPAPHRYEQQDSNAMVSVTTRYGETLSAPWVYVDMLQYWRRYE